MENYITKFNTEAEYNTFKDSPQMPYVNASYIIETGENKFYKEIYAQQQKPFTIEILSDDGSEHVHGIGLWQNTSGTCYWAVIRNNVRYEYSFNYNAGWDQCRLWPSPYKLGGRFLVGDKIEIICKNIPDDEHKPDVIELVFLGPGDWYSNSYPGDLTVKVSGNIMSLFTNNYVYATPLGLGMDNGVGGFRFCTMRWFFNSEDPNNAASSILVNAEDLFLPSRGLPRYAFEEMFKNAIGLVKGPNIYTKNSTEGICRSMFTGCTSLTHMPDIYIENIINGWGELTTMFEGCTSLVNTTTLHFKTIYDTWSDADGCFVGMFRGCTSLVDAPAWNEDYEILNKSGNAFYNMFEGCTSLETCDWNIYPEDSSISPMFRNTFKDCNALLQGPALNRGTDYIGGIYDSLYNGTYSSLNEFNYGKCAGPIHFNQSSFAASGTIYVADNSVYLDSSSQYYGQTPIQGWTVEAISNYPTT